MRPSATLVLLPGLDGTEIFFRPLLAVLPPWVRPVVVTYPTSGANDYSDLLAVVEAAIEDSDSEEIYILGWSFSGPLALMFAAKDPTRIRGVILCASFVRPPLPALAWLRFAIVSPVVYLVRLARRAPVFLANESTNLLWRDMAATWGRVPTRILVARARAIFALDARKHLRECQRPVLYLAGSRDRVVPAWNVKEVARELPSAKVVMIEGPHLALYTNPKAAVRAIVEFIKDSCRQVL